MAFSILFQHVGKADVLFVVLCLANQTGVNLQQSFDNMMEIKAERDHKRHHTNKKLK